MSALKRIVASYIEKVYAIEEVCDRCLKTERWGGSVVLMVVDAAFTSIGLNYFTAVVPKVEEFNRRFVENGKVTTLKNLAKADLDELRSVWRNRRSWIAAKEMASYFSLNSDDRLALRNWARKADFENWRVDPIGMVKGVGLVTFQYLRIMGGVDTVMPDKIVKRVTNEIFIKAGLDPVSGDLDFVKKVHEVASICGFRPIELCWMTWLMQREGKLMKMGRARHSF